MKKSAFTIIFLALLSILGTAVASGRLSPKQSAQKARYYYLEGVRLQSEGRDDEAYEMYKHSWRIDPSYEEAASAYGTLRMLLPVDTLGTFSEMDRSLSLMRGFVDKYPADINENLYYAYAAAQLDTIPEAIRIYERLTGLYPKRTDILLRLADLYAREFKKDDVLNALNRYEKIEGKSLQLSSRKTSFLLAAADTAAARAEVENFVKEAPSKVDALIFKGAYFGVIQQPDSAIHFMEMAEELDPDNGRIKLLLADNFKSKGDSVQYDLKTYEALLSEDFDLQDKLGVLTDYLRTALADSANTGRGDHLFEVLSEQYPHEPDLLELAASYAYAQKNFAKAKEQISYAIDLAPDVPQYYMALMTYQLETDDYADMIKTYDRATKHIKPNDTMLLLLASASSGAKDYTRAEEAFASALDQLIPGVNIADTLQLGDNVRNLDYESLMRASTIYSMLGDMYYQMKESPKAFLSYDNALRIMPYNYLTLNNYAYFLAENDEDLSRAHSMSKQAVEAVPDNPTYLDTYAYILFKEGDYPLALEYQQKAVKLSEDDKETGAELYDHLGDIQIMLGNADEAVKNWEKALSLDPENKTIPQKIKQKKYIAPPNDNSSSDNK